MVQTIIARWSFNDDLEQNRHYIFI